MKLTKYAVVAISSFFLIALISGCKSQAETEQEQKDLFKQKVVSIVKDYDKKIFAQENNPLSADRDFRSKMYEYADNSDADVARKMDLEAKNRFIKSKEVITGLQFPKEVSLNGQTYLITNEYQDFEKIKSEFSNGCNLAIKAIDLALDGDNQGFAANYTNGTDLLKSASSDLTRLENGAGSDMVKKQ